MKNQGGQTNYIGLIKSMSEKNYEIGKLYIWYTIIREGKEPKKWLKPNQYGTKVDYDTIKSQEQENRAFKKFKIFMDSVNSRFGTEYEMDLEIISKEGINK